MVTESLLESSWHFENRLSQISSVGNIQSSSGLELEGAQLLFPLTAKAIGKSKRLQIITFLRIMIDTQRTATFGKNSYSFLDSGPSCKRRLCLF